MIKIYSDQIILNTLNTSLIFKINSYIDKPANIVSDKKYLSLFYYGLNKSVSLVNKDNKLNYSGSNNNYNYDLTLTNTFGDCNNVEASILLENVDGSFVNRFFFVKAEITNKEIKNKLPHSRNVSETLLITEEDREAGLILKTYYSIFEDSDVIAVKKELINNNSKSIFIKNIASLTLPIQTNKLNIFTYDGSWLFERHRHETTLTSGVFMNESILFSSSHKHNPFIQVNDPNTGFYYAFNLIWSGNHKEFIDVDPRTNISVINVGVNSYCFSYELRANESFMSPEAIMNVASSLEETSKDMRRFSLNHIIDQKWKRPRPILFNSWEGCVFDISDDKLFKQADIVSKLGVELFVVDDGWFLNRTDDTKALGDWETDTNRFPKGLGYTAEVIRSKGLDFGFWLEPEMISKNSKLYKEHPEYACESSIREPLERRHQLMIDMSNPHVIDYLYNSISKVIEDTKVTYIKWDFNRNMSDAYSNYGTKAGEFMYKYVLGLYELVDKLVTNYPNILFEGCSSGGGRFDLGIAYYMPQSWGSDTTNAYVRSFISCGTFAGYPQSMMGAHISFDYCPIENENHFSSLDDRFSIQCLGGFGYEFDSTKLTDKDHEIIKEQTRYYKEHRELIQFGELEIIDNIFDNPDYYSYIITSSDKSEAIFSCVQTRPGVSKRVWKLKNLKKDSKYKLSYRKSVDSKDIELEKNIYTGLELMENGLALPELDKLEDLTIFSGLFTKMFYLKEIK